MEKIEHFMLPKETELVYDKEAISSISLTKVIANKINELIDNYNTLATSNYDKEIDQDGRIRQGILYMKDNLSNTINDLLNLMKSNGELNSIISESITTINNKLDLYYDEITTTKYRDTTSSSDYYITHIPHLDHSGNVIKLRLGIANDDTNLNTLESTLKFASRKGATLCINGGLADTSDNAMGTVIKNSNVLKHVPYDQPQFDFLGIKDDNTLISFNATNTSSAMMLNKGVTNALMGFYTIINGGQVISKNDSNATTSNPRQIICELYNKDIIILTVDGRSKNSLGMTINACLRVLGSYDIRMAYCLDGGGSTSTVLKGTKINKNIDDNGVTDRPVATFLYVTKNDENNIITDLYTRIGDLRQSLNKEIQSLVDVNSGYLNLYTNTGSLYPGISFFPNGQTIRSGKVIVNNSGFYVDQRSDITENEKRVIIANENGLYDVFGIFGQFKDIPKILTDCNDLTLRSGIYATGGSTSNKPNIPGAGYLLNLKLNASYIKQICIPATDDITYFRRYNGTDWTEWDIMNVYRGSTSNRPISPLTGTMYYDTTLGVPIWYTGSNWVNANGTSV